MSKGMGSQSHPNALRTDKGGAYIVELSEAHNSKFTVGILPIVKVYFIRVVKILKRWFEIMNYKWWIMSSWYVFLNHNSSFIIQKSNTLSAQWWTAGQTRWRAALYRWRPSILRFWFLYRWSTWWWNRDYEAGRTASGTRQSGASSLPAPPAIGAVPPWFPARSSYRPAYTP